MIMSHLQLLKTIMDLVLFPEEPHNQYSQIRFFLNFFAAYLNSARFDRLDQGVRVFRPDAVDQLPVRFLCGRVHPPDPRHQLAGGRGSARLADRVPALEQQDQEQVDQSHRVQRAPLVALERFFDRVRQAGPEQVVGDGGRAATQRGQQADDGGDGGGGAFVVSGGGGRVGQGGQFAGRALGAGRHRGARHVRQS